MSQVTHGVSLRTTVRSRRAAVLAGIAASAGFLLIGAGCGSSGGKKTTASTSVGGPPPPSLVGSYTTKLKKSDLPSNRPKS
jgi:hypothetical protein